MNIFFVVGGIAIIIICCLLEYFEFDNYESNKNLENICYINFKRFKRLYEANKDKWILNKDNALYNYNTRIGMNNLIDYKRYLKFRKKEQKRKKQLKQEELKGKFISELKKDFGV